MAEIKFEGHSFDKGFVASHKNVDEFLKVSNEEGHKHWFEGDANRKEKLTQIYQLAKKKSDVEEVVPEPEKPVLVDPLAVKPAEEIK